MKNLIQGEYTNDVQSFINDRRWYRTAANISRNFSYLANGTATVVSAYTAYSGDTIYAIIATSLGVVGSTLSILENKFSTEEAKSTNQLNQTLHKFGIEGKFDSVDDNDAISKKVDS